MTDPGAEKPIENRCEYCLRLHERYQRWCNEACAAAWMHEFYWPAWHTVLAYVLKTCPPDTDPREIGRLTNEQTLWLSGPPPSDCGKLNNYLAQHAAGPTGR